MYENERVLWRSCIFIDIGGRIVFFTGSDGVCAFTLSLAYPRGWGDNWVTLPCDREWANLNSISYQYTSHTPQASA